MGALLGTITRLLPLAAKLLPFLGAGVAYFAGRRGAAAKAKMESLETENETWRRRAAYGESVQAMSDEDLVGRVTQPRAD